LRSSEQALACNSTAADAIDQKINGVSVVMSALSQWIGANQNSNTTHGARVRSIALTPQPSKPPKAKGSTMAGKRMDNVLSPNHCSMSVIHQPTMGGWS
jgi:hypothetical protein